MNQKQLLEKIEALEKRVRELEVRPVYVPYYPPCSPHPDPWQRPYFPASPWYYGPVIT